MNKTVIPQEQIRQSHILVVGDMMLDRYWFGDVERISPEAPVPVVQVKRSDERLGGAANVARNAAALGARVGMLGVVGDDEPARTLEALLAESHVQPYLHRDAKINTTIKLRVVAHQQQLLRVDFENTPAHEVLLAVQDRFQGLINDYQVLVLSDYGKGGLTHVTRMIDAGRAAGRKVLVDPKGDDYSRYRGATLITPNRAEMRAVVGAWKTEADLTIRAQNLRRALQLEALLLTRSEEGMTLYTEAEVLHVSAQAREVYDVSGAGDTVIATLATMMGAGVPLKEAVQHANRAGGIVVGKLGTAVVTYPELFGAAA
ncbi:MULTISPECIES: D-glycero-beta-D-manno-heptose-7-phosphate kinase [Cupriavidus]|uniref:ADP-HEPTOSE SYNTHASE PROTEIN (Fused heptose 7-phosphate kinase heptose 1-phosphate adenyltransferase) n=1 Tax=Cupriavidus taiwanensis (strain DSM 17343 / BCRC 17206 / CCUG 44338 / CIP 107171 / LMG 19424 / R1) TaxID=977880 RepID=B3R3B9_CUPTR|nr:MULTISPECIES: D-glycero-beta-D-manno-heptose-7-phosphate kinase [Cupriavidus]UDM49684.1 D-glycero-beta-D-manno-heptose-7-phosphate kinase [Cupriavidus sp. MP-37]CAQ68756.1 ADP-HEPTOSE SYNTHASE PROTEIN (fused heptose 7-phosphate kinase; heptose 1-phosphate adenyltransferase) [Cupriavidus taiwanensis LMG 19424]SOY55900.1 ADP-HEPTOSE SYNTHASE PROTEIN (fused heptose 7-phosphate kinase; heptose 1-phosphate adenyltransferase) [Cupriavidus taiwanensis]SPC06806.1 D-beta-D-heptose 7-phosphate kinase 